MTDFIQIGNVSIATEPLGTGGNAIVTLGNSTVAPPVPVGGATAAKQDTGNTSLASIDTKLGTTLAADIAAIRTNTAKISQFSFQLAEDTAGTVFLIRTDTIAGTSANINVATGLAFTPVGAIELTDPIASQITIEQNEYDCLTTNGANWTTGDIIERIRTLNTTTGAVLTTSWYNAAGTLLVTIPVIGTDVVDSDRQSLVALKSIDSKTPAQAVLADTIANPTTRSQGAFGFGFNGATWDRLRSGLVGVQTTFIGLLNTISMARYNVTPPVLADGNVAPLQLDSVGNLKIVDNMAVPIRYLDIPSSTITATTTSTSFVPLSGLSFKVGYTASAFTGTSLVVTVEESFDGVLWQTLYTFPTITAAGRWVSDPLPNRAAFIRYTETFVGTSVTRLVRRATYNEYSYAQITTKLGGVASAPDLPLTGRALRLTANNRTATQLFLQFHDKGAPLATGDVPFDVMPLGASTGLISLGVADLGANGTALGVNPRLALSTTFGTYTALASTVNTSLFVEVIKN